MRESKPEWILPRELVLASAGTGKTFALSSRMIGLLALGAHPDSILASTFTRKAAGEILDRVLARVARGALDGDEARALATHALLLPTDRGLSEDALQERFSVLLQTLVRNLHRLNVGTLDSFFIRIARSFSGELGIPPDWQIADEPTALRLESEALHQVLRAGSAGERMELVRMILRGEAGRRIHDRLMGQLAHLQEILRQVDFQRLAQGEDPWLPFPETEEAPPPDREAREGAAQALEEGPTPRTKSGKPDGNFRKAQVQGARDLRAGAWEDFCRRGLGRKVLEGEETFRNKAVPEPVLAAVREGLALARRALAGELNREMHALGRLVRAWDGALGELQARRGAFRFRDITWRLGGEDPVGGRPDLWYRLDQRAQHLLLDEFQDTALSQWEALLPLAQEIASGHDQERSLVVVADPKQSIYGWRGAEPLMVHRVGKSMGLEHRSLERSYRSSQVVLDLVNRVFQGLEQNPGWGEDDTGRRVAAEWLADFPPHGTARDRPGHVRVRVGPRDENMSRLDRPEMMTWAAREIRDMVERASGGTVGVLVRTNRAVARLITELRTLGLEASEEGSTALTDSPAVAAILAALRMADHPGDTLARYHVASSPLGSVLGCSEFADGEGCRKTAGQIREDLMSLGYGELLAGWVQALGQAEALGERDLQRLLQLVELGYRWDSRATLRPTDFVRFVESERMEATSHARIRVMTVHQAKGLEFDAVVLPELDVPLRGQGRPSQGPLPLRDRDTGKVRRVYPRLKKEVRPLFPAVEEAALQEEEQQTRDGLGILYVALTRARHALYLFLAEDPEPLSPSGRPTLAGLLRGGLGLDADPLASGRTVHESGSWSWGEKERPAGRLPRTEDDSALLLSPPPLARRPRNRLFPQDSPSSLTSLGTARPVDLRRVLSLGSPEGRLLGTVVHAWLEHLVWLEEWDPDPETLRRIARREAPELPEEEVGELRARLGEWLDAPEVATRLRRNSYGGGARVRTEHPFAVRLDGVILQGRMDRVVTMAPRGEVLEAEVLDYKTDVLGGERGRSLEEAVEEYRDQVEAYRRALARIQGLEPDRVKASLIFLQAGRVVELEPRSP